MVEVATTSILIFNLKSSLIEWGDLNLNLSKAFTRRFTMNKYGAWTNDIDSKPRSTAHWKRTDSSSTCS